MEVSAGKALTMGAIISLIILLGASQGGTTAASLTNFSGSSDRFATIAANMELEFLMDSEIGRMLAGVNSQVTKGTENPEEPAVDCGRGNPYSGCTPPGNKNPTIPEKCAKYKRGCSTPP